MANYNYNENKYPTDKKYDFTMVGAGTAGMFLAMKLAQKGRKVLIIESGQKGINPKSQELNTAITSGNKTMGSHNWGRKRALGGTSLAWGGQALPFGELDLKNRDWVQNGGWPITLDDLTYHYNRASEFLGIDTMDYRKDILEQIKVTDPGFDPGKLDFHVAKWAKEKDFYKVYEKSKLDGIDIIYNAILRNVYHENGKINSVDIVNTEGNSLRFPVANLILANGTIESVRTLLYNKLSQSNLVGKAFMDHPCVEVGIITRKDSYSLQSLFAPHIKNGNYYSLRMTLSPEMQVNKKLLNASAGVMFTAKPGEPNPYTDFKLFAKSLKPKHLLTMMRYSGQLFTSLFTYLKKGFLYKGMFEGRVVIMAEQEPSFDSTIRLSEEKDIAGIPKPEINWNLTHKTWESVVTTSQNIKDELERLGLGTVILFPHIKQDETDWRVYLTDVCHHMGGARMSDKPEEGVVDKNLKVWGTENLFVCSPAVYPTGSHSNPVLTLLALSNRLSDYLLLFSPKPVGKSLSDSVSSASISY